MKSLDHYLALPYELAVTREACSDGTRCFVARVIDLPGCESHGDTPDTALKNLETAKRLYVKSMLDDGLVPPAPVLRAKAGKVAKTPAYRPPAPTP